MAHILTEKKWLEIVPRAFTANGGNDGQIDLISTLDFHVKQDVFLKSTTQAPLKIEIKRVISLTRLEVGPRGNIQDRSDLSAYLLTDSATIEAHEQPRSSVPLTEHERAVYAEEPIIAKRVIAVDQLGDYFSDTNPFPVSVSGITIPPLEVMLTHLDNYPNPGDVHDSVRVGDGTDLLEITAQKEARVADTLHTTGTNTVLNVTNVPIEIKVGASALTTRKTLIAVPRKKGVYWGFKANVDTTDGVNGGIPLGKNQPLEIDAEANLKVYLVGPVSGIKVAIGEV